AEGKRSQGKARQGKSVCKLVPLLRPSRCFSTSLSCPPFSLRTTGLRSDQRPVSRNAERIELPSWRTWLAPRLPRAFSLEAMQGKDRQGDVKEKGGGPGRATQD